MSFIWLCQTLVTTSSPGLVHNPNVRDVKQKSKYIRICLYYVIFKYMLICIILYEI